MSGDFSDIKCFDVLAVDQFLDRKWIADNIQPKKIIQGNLDPLFLTQKTAVHLWHAYLSTMIFHIVHL
mgnify:CR=1 FL=1